MRYSLGGGGGAEIQPRTSQIDANYKEAVVNTDSGVSTFWNADTIASLL
jgi:hypothetical protein